LVGAALGDRVRHWSTINEPWCASMLGYAAGLHAPGRTEPGAAVAAAHHLLLAHGLGVDALRTHVRADAVIGITLNPYPVVAAGERDEDIDAARRVDGVANRLWYDAVLRGKYPDDVLDDFSAVSDLAHIHDDDLAQISRPLDALGVNYYRRYHVRAVPGASAVPPHAQWPGSSDIELVQPDGPVTDGGWSIEPDGLRDVLVALTTAYDPPPVYVHEAGAAFNDDRGADGAVHDTARIDWLEAHLREALGTIDDGVDLRGFFVWSLFDNFEWAEGYAHRFGIVHVDFATLERTPKDSAHWFQQVPMVGW
jgi:beta-glucosidase